MFPILLISLLFIPHNSKCDYIDHINPHKNWGVWEGWGTSLAWWANVFGDRDDLADILFTTKEVKLNGKTLPGLGFNIARYNVGGCSWNSIGTEHMVASPHIPKFKQIEGFWLNSNSSDPNSKSWDWTVDKNQREMVKKALARGADHIELFSNSPMWWMLTNHNPSGADDGGENLQKSNYQQFAVYLSTVAKYAADHWNIDFVSVEPFNEASTTWWRSGGSQEGCHFGSETQQQVIKYLREELDKRGLTKTIISASDESLYVDAVKIWNSFPADVKSKVGRVNVHGYEYALGKRDVLYDIVHKDGKSIWNSEYGEGDASGLPMAENICLDLFWLHPTAWVYWQPLDTHGWAMIVSDMDTKSSSEISPKYYVMAQFSRHIRKGMLIIDHDHSDAVIAYDQTAHRLVIVAFNRDKAQNITFDLSQFSRVDSGTVNRWTTNTKGGDLYVEHKDLKISSKSISVSFAERTVQTIEINNVFI